MWVCFSRFVVGSAEVGIGGKLFVICLVWGVLSIAPWVFWLVCLLLAGLGDGGD